MFMCIFILAGIYTLYIYIYIHTYLRLCLFVFLQRRIYASNSCDTSNRGPYDESVFSV